MYQYVTLDACSSRLYHMAESTTNAGWQADSNSPRSVRTTSSPTKFLQTAWQARTAPQAVIQKPKYFPTGTREMI